MNMQVPMGVQPPPQPKSLAETGLTSVMMRDILLKTMFRMNLDLVSDLSRAISLPVVLVQELVDAARQQRMLEAKGTQNATSASNEMGYQQTARWMLCRNRNITALCPCHLPPIRRR